MTEREFKNIAKKWSELQKAYLKVYNNNSIPFPAVALQDYLCLIDTNLKKNHIINDLTIRWFRLNMILLIMHDIILN